MYQLIKREYQLEEKSYIGYGISYNQTEIPDISTSYEKIVKLLSLCNELSLDPVHLPDVIDDFLTEA